MTLNAADLVSASASRPDGGRSGAASSGLPASVQPNTANESAGRFPSSSLTS
jgi:hypothetical protein